jgi:hypothetical protein
MSALRLPPVVWTRPTAGGAKPYGGSFRVRGTVMVSGSPAARRVVLFEAGGVAQPWRPVLSTWSAADGSYSFERIADSEYIVIAFDYTRDKNAAIADFVRPEPMP